MSAFRQLTKKAGRFRLLVFLGLLLILWISFALFLHPIDFQDFQSNNLLPGGERINAAGYVLLHITSAMISPGTLARMCSVILAYFLARFFSLRSLSEVSSVKDFGSVSRFISRVLFAIPWKYSMDASRFHQAEISTDLKQMGGPAEIDLRGNPSNVCVLDDDGCHSPNEDHFELSKGAKLLMDWKNPQKFVMNMICRTKDGIRVGFSGIQCSCSPSVPSTNYVNPGHMESQVQTAISTAFNKIIRARNYLDLIVSNESKESPSRIRLTPTISKAVQKLSPAQPFKSLQPPFVIRVINTPEDLPSLSSPVVDFLTQMVKSINDVLAHNYNDELEIKVLSISEWKCMSAAIQDQTRAIFKQAAIPSEYIQPQDLNQRIIQLDKEIQLNMLEQLSETLSSSSQESRDIVIALFFFEFLGRRMEEYRFEGLAIPEKVLNMIDTLEQQISHYFEKDGSKE